MDQDFFKQTTLPHLPEEPFEKKIPSKIGPYKIEGLLNKGGMSLLYLGLSQSNEPIAIKVLSPSYLSHPEMVDQFLKEAQIIALTDHPNIVKLYGQGEWEKGLYIAMEFIQGISLKQFIIQHSLSLKRSLEIILQVAYALLHLHTHGVIHRDLKPENILITEEGKVKVIDFGIAQLTMEEEKYFSPLGGIIGTPSYMSPEQRKNPLNVAFSTDTFSLGIILYELVIGKLSYGNIQLNLLPKKLRPIVEKSLQPDQEKRYQDIVDFITDISTYLKAETYLEDRGGEDEIKELRESLQSSYTKLLPSPPRTWNELDIGLAKSAKFMQFGIYFDFFLMDDRSYLFFLAQTLSSGTDALIPTVLLKGILQKEMQMASSFFTIDQLAANLNHLFHLEKLKALIAVNILHLAPKTDSFSFISCGFDSIWHHVLSNFSSRQLINRNPPLGKIRGHRFYSVTDQWQEGDSLLMHTFHGFDENTLEIEKKDKDIQKVFLETVHLSSASCADHTLKAISELYLSVDQRSHAAIVIQRIA